MHTTLNYEVCALNKLFLKTAKLTCLVFYSRGVLIERLSCAEEKLQVGFCDNIGLLGGQPSE